MKRELEASKGEPTKVVRRRCTVCPELLFILKKLSIFYAIGPSFLILLNAGVGPRDL